MNPKPCRNPLRCMLGDLGSRGTPECLQPANLRRVGWRRPRSRGTAPARICGSAIRQRKGAEHCVVRPAGNRGPSSEGSHQPQPPRPGDGSPEWRWRRRGDKPSAPRRHQSPTATRSLPREPCRRWICAHFDGLENRRVPPRYPVPADERSSGHASLVWRRAERTGDCPNEDHAIFVSPSKAKDLPLYERKPPTIIATGTALDQRGTFASMTKAP